MKKTLAFLAASAAISLLAGCGSASNVASNQKSTGAKSVSSTESKSSENSASDASSKNPNKIVVVSGAEVTTNGFADLGKMTYINTKNIILIDDANYKTAESKRKAFINAIASGNVGNSSITANAALIILSGTVDLSDGKVSDDDHSYFDAFDPQTHKKVHKDFLYDIGSNKTIIGVNNAKVAYGGLRIKAGPDNKAENIIIQNIAFWDAHGSTDYDTSIPQYSDKKASADQLSVEGTYEKGIGTTTFFPTNIWIDHCSFSDGKCIDLDRNFNHDGALDIRTAHNMTVSYCEFTNHDKVTLMGASDKFIAPEDRQVTFHHNYYHGAVQRMPRARGCEVHLYNNVYDKIGTSKNSGYSLGPGIGSQFVVESNYFGTHAGKILRYADKSKKGDATFSNLYVSGNSPELNDSNSESFTLHHSETKPFEINYDYTLDSVDDVKANIPSFAGPVADITVNGESF